MSETHGYPGTTHYFGGQTEGPMVKLYTNEEDDMPHTTKKGGYKSTPKHPKPMAKPKKEK